MPSSPTPAAPLERIVEAKQPSKGFSLPAWMISTPSTAARAMRRAQQAVSGMISERF
jgi:hypothetical protein